MSGLLTRLLDGFAVGSALRDRLVDWVGLESTALPLPPLAHPPITRTPSIFILDRAGDVACVLCNEPPSDPTAQASCRFWADEHKEGLDGTLTYLWSQEALHPDAEHSVMKAEAIFRDQDGQPRLVRIERVDTVQDGDTHYLRVYAENAAQELLGHPVRKPASASTAVTATAVLTGILAGSRWQPGVVEYDGLHTPPDDYMTALEAVRNLEAESTLEARYRCTFDGSRVTGRFIDLLLRRGRDTGKVIEYGKDLLGMTMINDGMPLYTRHIPLGRADAAGNRLLITGVTWGASDPMLKAAGLDYLDNPEASALYGPGGDPITRFVDLPDCVTAEALIHACYPIHLLESNPQPTYEISVAFLERAFGITPGSTAPFEQEAMRLGDGVTVRNARLGVTTSQRIQTTTASYSGLTSAPGIGGTSG